MALTIGKVDAPDRSYVIGDRVEVIVDITLDASYTTGGYSLVPSDLGLTTFTFVDAIPKAAGAGTVSSYAYDYTNKKLMALLAGVEISNATDLHTINARLLVKGKGFATRGTS